MPKDNTFGKAFTRIPRVGHFHPPRLVRGAVHSSGRRMHSVVFICFVALGNDRIPLEGRLHWDISP